MFCAHLTAQSINDNRTVSDAKNETYPPTEWALQNIFPHSSNIHQTGVWFVIQVLMGNLGLNFWYTFHIKFYIKYCYS